MIKGRKPLFIFGPPRSGTTLLRETLVSTGNVWMPACTPSYQTLDALGIIYSDMIREFGEAGKGTIGSDWIWGPMRSYIADANTTFPKPENRRHIVEPGDLKSAFRQLLETIIGCAGLHLNGNFTHIGWKDVRSGCVLTKTMHMLFDVLGQQQFVVFCVIRHPWDHMESYYNAAHLENNTTPHVPERDLNRIVNDWKMRADEFIKAAGYYPNEVQVVNYERRADSYKRAHGFAGLAWGPGQQQILDGPKLNHSKRVDAIPDHYRGLCNEMWHNHPISEM